MKDTEKRSWLCEHSADCSIALDTLHAAKRQAASEYDVRIRKITAFHETILVNLKDGDQLDLFNPDTALDPELAQLLRNPLHGLD